MAYTYEQVFAADPANPSNIAQNAAITIFAPGDATMTPLTITDPDGQPLANPIPVNANGFGSAFAHATLDRVAWAGGGFTGFFTSYEGMKNEAVAARSAAETAASTAGASAAAVATAAIGTATNDANAAAASAATAASNASASATAAANSAALVGAPADSAIAAVVNNGASATKAALNAAYAPTAGSTSYAAKSAETTAATAYSMAVKGFAPKTRPVNKMWAFPGAAGHGFVSAGSAGTSFNLDDTTDYALGDRSVRITTAGTGAALSTYASVTKTGLVIDATAQYVRVWVKVDDVTKVAQLNILLGDNTFTNYFTGLFYKSTTEAKSHIKSGEWTSFDIPWGSMTTTGAPSRAAITAARVLIYDNGSVGPAVIRFNGVAGVSEQATYPNGVISLTFDDTYASAQTIARPYMDKYGYAGTLYPITALFGTAGRLTLAQAKALMTANGWDFGYHATSQATHDTGAQNMTAQAFAAECEALRIWAKDNGVRGDSFAWPLTTFNSTAETVAANYFRTARAGLGDANETLPPPLPYRLRTIGTGAGDTLASVQARIDKVKAGKGWGVLTFHDIVASGATGNDVTTATFQGIIDYINTQGVAVATVAQVMDRI